MITCALGCDQERADSPIPMGGGLPPLGNTPAQGGALMSEAGERVGGSLAGSLVAGVMAGEGDGGAGTGGGAGGAGVMMGGATSEGGTQGGAIMPTEEGTRACSVTITGFAEGDTPLLFASSVTGWAEDPIELPLIEREADGLARYELTLSAREGLGLTLGLEEGVRYPYKLIQGDVWRLNPEASLQAFDGACANSAFMIPSCEEPTIELEPVTSEWSNGSGSVTLNGRALRGAGEGSELRGLDVTLDGEPLPVEPEVRTGLFSVSLTSLSPGKHRLTLRTSDASGRVSELLIVPFWIEADPFEWEKTPMYMILVDRFANGQVSSDAPIGTPVAPIADWRGGDLQGVTEAIRAGYFDELGVRALWLSPINEQVQGHFEDRAGEGRRFAAYHGYWPISGRRVDPRYGGDEGLRALVSAAHERGIRVLLDLINNQVHEQHEYYQSYPSWFRTSCVCGAEAGCGWSERPLDCLFASYLPDINWREPAAEEQFIADALYWVEEFDVDGFRVDAVKHVETTSIYNLREALTRRFERGGERVWMFGETAVGEADRFDDGCGVRYENGYEWIDAYTGRTALDGQFDFPTHHRTRWNLLSEAGDLSAVADAYQDAVDQYQPSAKHVRFLGSHDTPRISSESAGDLNAPCVWPGQTGCTAPAGPVEDLEVITRLKRAWATLYMSPGIPLLYYGDELALPGAGDPDNRRPMPWDGLLSTLNLDSEQSVTDTQRDLKQWLSSLGQLRARSDAIAHGQLTTLWRSSARYIFARLDEQGRGVIVALNRGETFSESLSAPSAWAGLEESLPRVLSSASSAERADPLTLSGGLLTLTLSRGEVAIFERR